MMRYLSKKYYLVIFFLLTACADPVYKTRSFFDRKVLYQFEKQLVQGGDFFITTYQKITDPASSYVFYIEGDGNIAGRYGITANPTPKYSTLMRLVAMDHRPNVVYISRPCQYTPITLNAKCNNNEYWNEGRFSNEVVAALNQVVETINHNGKKFTLVGYSGGGAIAILIAARNENVKDVVTIAGNLDIVEFTKYHNSFPLTKSLNPIDYAGKTRLIPQLHLSGKSDVIVPSFILQKYYDKASSSLVKMKILESVTHSRGWDIFWKELINSNFGDRTTM